MGRFPMPRLSRSQSDRAEIKVRKVFDRVFSRTRGLTCLSRRQTICAGCEIVVPLDGKLSFDNLLMRIHPAASRIQKLSESTPSIFIVFDLLVDDSGESLVKMPIGTR